jgi:ADP-ribosylglycohydrolase
MGAMMGVAIGDAMGMPSQTLTKAQILRHYGRIDGFVAPVSDHKVSHGLRAAMVTDDTEQTVLLARQIIACPDAFDDAEWAKTLLSWEKDMRRRGLRDLLGPSSKAAIASLARGVPASQTGRNGTTNGASMRIIPVGIATPAADLDALVLRVVEASRLTHNTREAIAAASAVAAVVSLGLEGATFENTLPMALRAAETGGQQGEPVGEVDMAGRIALALSCPDEASLARDIGTSVASRCSVAAAFGVVRLAGGDPWAAAVISANIGDDTDTIGAIAVGMAGACRGLTAFPAARVEAVIAANALDLDPLVEALLAIRKRRSDMAQHRT